MHGHSPTAKCLTTFILRRVIYFLIVVDMLYITIFMTISFEYTRLYQNAPSGHCLILNNCTVQRKMI